MKKTPVSTLAAVAAAIALITLAPAAQAESVEGVLETGLVWSALFGVSGESGDLVGHAFRNQSGAGRAILAACVPGLWCKAGKANTRELRDLSQLAFAERPSGWLEITSARQVGMEAAVAGHDKSVKTRRGIVSISDDETLSFKGRPALPKVEANSSLSFVASYELDRVDVLLLQNNGGSACPALYRFITVSASGIATTPEFGTCSDLIYPTSDGQASITVAMPTFAGPGSNKARLSKSVYRYQAGQVTENGKPVR